MSPPAPFTSFQEDSRIAPFVASHRADLARQAKRLSRLTANTIRFGSQLSIRFRHWFESEAVSALENTVHTGAHLSTQLKIWLASEAAPAIGRTARATLRLWVRITHWSESKVASALGSTGRAASQVFTHLRNRLIRDAATATERTIRTATRHPVRVVNTPATEAAGTTKSNACRTPQVSSVLKNMLGPRRCRRVIEPPVVAYCWTADTPDYLKVADISSGGVHLLTDVRWPLGGRLSMTLQRTDRTKGSPESWIVIDFMVLRWCRDGVAGAFIPSTHPLSRYAASHAENCADPQTLKHFVKRLAIPGRW